MKQKNEDDEAGKGEKAAEYSDLFLSFLLPPEKGPRAVLACDELM